jgi:hypothetical protein
MTREFYEQERKRLSDALTKLREDYIEINKPYPIGSIVKMMLGSGRIVEGKILELGMDKDKKVYVTSYKCKADNKIKYCTVAQQKYKLLDG